MISVILIEPSLSGNLGAICRSMKNFGLKDLILINPKCNKDSKTAHNRAKHAQDILNNAKVKDLAFLKRFDYLVATTAKTGRDYNIRRTPLTPEELSVKLNSIEKKNKTKKRLKIGIIFGREGIGLTNKEIDLCDFSVTIPSSKSYPTLNLSHASTILFYELFKEKESNISNFIPVGKKEKQNLLKLINKKIDSFEFSTKEKRQTQRLLWKRIIGKAMLTRREAFALFGFFKKIR